MKLFDPKFSVWLLTSRAFCQVLILVSVLYVHHISMAFLPRKVCLHLLSLFAFLTLAIHFSLQEGPRGGQEVPQGVRGGAQGSVVHRLPLEKGLPALPGLEAPGAMAREKERERRGWTDGCVTTRDFYQKENINQGPRAISCFTCVFFYFQPVSFLS